MTDSSQPKNLSTDLFNDIVTNVGATGSDVYTITLPDMTTTVPYISTTDTITITGAVGSSYTLNDTVTFDNFNWGDAEEWVDAFPDWRRVQDMCKKYPGLEIALRNFQTVYTLVKDDYDNPKDES